MKYFKDLNSMEAVKKQYRKLAMKHHPDRGGNEEIFKAINKDGKLIKKIGKKNIPYTIEELSIETGHSIDLVKESIDYFLDTEMIENTVFEEIRAELEARKDRSAWDRGVTAYALELVDELEELAAYEGRNPETVKECREWMLNGAQNWSQYSWGGSSLIYDRDIAERLCTPSELKKTRHGERRPNSREEWLDTQARALYQACERVSRLYVSSASKRIGATA